jgi:hypothetical protein
MVTETPLVYTPLTRTAPIIVQEVGSADKAQGIEMHVKMASAARAHKTIINLFFAFSIYSPLIYLIMKDDALIEGAFHPKGR